MWSSLPLKPAALLLFLGVTESTCPPGAGVLPCVGTSAGCGRGRGPAPAEASVCPGRRRPPPPSPVLPLRVPTPVLTHLLARSRRGGLQRATASIFTSGRSPPSVRSGEHARQGRVRAGFGPTPVAGGVRGGRCEGSRHRVHACGAVARFWGSAQGRAASLWPLGAAQGSGRARQSSRAAHARAGTGGGATGLPRWGGDSRLVSPREGALGSCEGGVQGPV